MGDVLKVFCSYTTSDRERVVEAGHRLAAAGIEPLVDIWEIRFGDPIVQRVDEMIRRCDAGLIFVSKEALASNWVCGEMEALVKQSIERGKRVFAVRLESDIDLPPLLDRYKAADYSDFKTVIDNLLGHTGKPQVAEARKTPRICPKLAVRIRPLEGGKVGVQAFFQDEPVAEEHSAEPGVGFHFSYADFLADRFPLSRETGAESQSARQAVLVKLGDNLGRILFPGEIGKAVSEVIERELKSHSKILLEWQSEDHSILSWPFEAAILPGQTRPLALERELQTVLDALEEAQEGKQGLAEILFTCCISPVTDCRGGSRWRMRMAVPSRCRRRT